MTSLEMTGVFISVISSGRCESRDMSNKSRLMLYKTIIICYLRAIKNLLFLTKTL